MPGPSRPLWPARGLTAAHRVRVGPRPCPGAGGAALAPLTPRGRPRREALAGAIQAPGGRVEAHGRAKGPASAHHRAPGPVGPPCHLAPLTPWSWPQPRPRHPGPACSSCPRVALADAVQALGARVEAPGRARGYASAHHRAPGPVGPPCHLALLRPRPPAPGPRPPAPGPRPPAPGPRPPAPGPRPPAGPGRPFPIAAHPQTARFAPWRSGPVLSGGSQRPLVVAVRSHEGAVAEGSAEKWTTRAGDSGSTPGVPAERVQTGRVRPVRLRRGVSFSPVLLRVRAVRITRKEAEALWRGPTRLPRLRS
ncbi:hypothetical protein SUDANB182_03053 [Streptomyces sp. SudanB182_2057]